MTGRPPTAPPPPAESRPCRPPIRRAEWSGGLRFSTARTAPVPIGEAPFRRVEWPLRPSPCVAVTVVWVALGLLCGGSIVGLLELRQSLWHGDRPSDSWVAVVLRRDRTPLGPEEVIEVEVRNPSTGPTIVTVGVRPTTALLWRLQAPLSIRTERPDPAVRLPLDTVLGAVAGGSSAHWLVPVPHPGPRRPLTVSVVVHQIDRRARRFRYVLVPPRANPFTTPA